MKFGLLMIVRDEEPIVARALKSVLPLVDYYLISDTGSIDNTIQIIKEVYKDVPGNVVEHEWKNFGHNRSVLFDLASQNKDIDYWFWLDADEVFVKPDKSAIDESDRIGLENFLANTDANIIYLTTHFGELRYPRLQIAKNNQKYWWKYPAHEVLVITKTSKTVEYFHIVNWARKEGNSSRDPTRNSKYIKWFEEYLETNPDDSRAVFYLARSQRDNLLYGSANQNYLRRFDLGGYAQEIFISLLDLGHMTTNYEALSYYLRAVYQFPERLEGYYYAGTTLGKLKQHQNAIDILAKGLKQATFNNSHLFLQSSIYTWMAEFQMAIEMYYTDDYYKGYQIIKNQLENNKIDSAYVEHVKRQLVMFEKKII